MRVNGSLLGRCDLATNTLTREASLFSTLEAKGRSQGLLYFYLRNQVSVLEQIATQLRLTPYPPPSVPPGSDGAWVRQSGGALGEADDTKSLWESAVPSRWTACPRNEVEGVVQREQCHHCDSNLL